MVLKVLQKIVAICKVGYCYFLVDSFLEARVGSQNEYPPCRLSHRIFQCVVTCGLVGPDLTHSLSESLYY